MTVLEVRVTPRNRFSRYSGGLHVPKVGESQYEHRRESAVFIIFSTASILRWLQRLSVECGEWVYKQPAVELPEKHTLSRFVFTGMGTKMDNRKYVCASCYWYGRAEEAEDGCPRCRESVEEVILAKAEYDTEWQCIECGNVCRGITGRTVCTDCGSIGSDIFIRRELCGWFE